MFHISPAVDSLFPRARFRRLHATRKNYSAAVYDYTGARAGPPGASQVVTSSYTSPRIREVRMDSGARAPLLVKLEDRSRSAAV